MPLSQPAVAATDGWFQDAARTWTRASNTSFTVSGVNVTAQFPKGTRLKVTDTTTKYFVVTAASFSTDTTVTITGGSDYSLSATPTAQYYSYDANPQGWPAFFNYAATLVGWSGTPTKFCTFSVVGQICFVTVYVSGTSNATNATVTAPIPWGDQQATMETYGIGSDNGALLIDPMRISVGGTAIATFYTRSDGAAWTATGTKVVQGQYFYWI